MAEIFVAVARCDGGQGSALKYTCRFEWPHPRGDPESTEARKSRLNHSIQRFTPLLRPPHCPLYQPAAFRDSVGASPAITHPPAPHTIARHERTATRLARPDASFPRGDQRPRTHVTMHTRPSHRTTAPMLSTVPTSTEKWITPCLESCLLPPMSPSIIPFVLTPVHEVLSCVCHGLARILGSYLRAATCATARTRAILPRMFTRVGDLVRELVR